MSVRIMSKVFDSDLPTGERMVLLAMADFANDAGSSIYPSIATLSKKCGLSPRGTQQLIKRLQEKGYIELEKKGGGRLANSWRIIPERFEGCSTFTPAVHTVHPTGAPDAPYPLYNHQGNIEDPVYEDLETVTQKKKNSRSGNIQIAEALAEVTGMSMDINKAVLMKFAWELSKDPRVSDVLIRSVYDANGVWYNKDWRGKLGQKPTLPQILATLFSYEDREDNVIRGSLKERPTRERGGLK